MSSPGGDPVDDEPCPKCHKVAIEYNGNYYCTNCNWAMSEGGRPKRIVISYLQQKELEYARKGDAKNAERMRFHLKEYE